MATAAQREPATTASRRSPRLTTKHPRKPRARYLRQAAATGPTRRRAGPTGATCRVPRERSHQGHHESQETQQELRKPQERTIQRHHQQAQAEQRIASEQGQLIWARQNHEQSAEETNIKDIAAVGAQLSPTRSATRSVPSGSTISTRARLRRDFPCEPTRRTACKTYRRHRRPRRRRRRRRWRPLRRDRPRRHRRPPTPQTRLSGRGQST